MFGIVNIIFAAKHIVKGSEFDDTGKQLKKTGKKLTTKYFDIRKSSI